MRKLVIVLRSAQTGGVENHALQILKSAPRYGYKPVLISLADVPVSKLFTDLNIEIHSLQDSMTSSIRSIMNVLPLAKIFKDLKPDVIHLHGARPMFVGSIAARLYGHSNVVSTLHGSYKLMAYDKSTSLLDPLRHLESRIVHVTAFLLSKKVIVDADALASEIKGACWDLSFLYEPVMKKTITIYPCVDFSSQSGGLERGTMRKNLGFDNDSIILGSIGRIDEPMKGIRVLLDAIKILYKGGTRFYAVIVGEGYSRKELEKYAEDVGLSNIVRFLGFWDNLQEIFDMIDIFVLPSFSEGFPLVNLEAMQNGIPVVATDVGGVREAITDGVNGLVVPPRDPVKLATALKNVIQDNVMRERMGESARETARERFSLQLMLDKIFSVYDEMTRAT